MAPWFTELDLTHATTAQQRILRRVTQLLSTLQPARLIPREQMAELAPGDAVRLLLRHDTESWLQIEARIGTDNADFYGVMGHDETYSSDFPGQGEGDALEVLTSLLTAPYRHEVLTVNGRPWRTVTQIGSPADVSVHLPEGPLGYLPLGFCARRSDTRYAGFGCRAKSASTEL